MEIKPGQIWMSKTVGFLMIIIQPLHHSKGLMILVDLDDTQTIWTVDEITRCFEYVGEL